MRSIILIFFIIETTLEACSSGCIKCSKTNDCAVCDTKSLYYLNGTVCQQSNKINCKFIDKNNNCVSCLSNYYLDSNTGSCVQIGNSFVIPNCMIYSPNKSCISCLPNYFLGNEKCNSVNITVSSCAIYATNGVCSICFGNQILSSNGKLCTNFATKSNCQVYSYARCDSCKSGFLLDRNLYMSQLFSPSVIANAINSDVQFITNSVTTICQAYTVLNCLNYTSFNACSLCKTGFYLINGTCYANPPVSIQNCMIYTSNTVCKTCKIGFFLNSNKCMPIVKIDQCLTYDNQASNSICILCATGSYLSTNACKNRIVSQTIKNCLTYNIGADSCFSCSPGFTVTSDSLSCLVSITNCTTYADSSSTTIIHNCNLCDSGYYYVSNSIGRFCVLGTVKNCETYQINTNTCTKCANTYYYSNSLCVFHIQIVNCNIYSQSQANVCSNCQIGFYSFQLFQLCELTTLINNCQTYSNDGLTCTLCNDGFYLFSNTECRMIPVNYPSCLQIASNVCSKCLPNYAINVFSSTSGCSQLPDYITTNCLSVSLTTANYCISCMANSYYFNVVKNEAICIKSTDLNFYPGFQSITNCKRYGWNTASTKTVICMECMSDYFLKSYWNLGPASSSLVCVSSCSTADKSEVFIPSDFNGLVQICIPATALSSTPSLINCQAIVRTTWTADFTLADFNCLQPTVGFLGNFDINPVNGYAYESYLLTASSIIDYNTNPISIDFVHGFALNANMNWTPSVFNLKGVIFKSILETNSLIFTQTSVNCELLFQAQTKASVNNQSGPKSGTYIIQSGILTSCLKCKSGYQPVFPVNKQTENQNIPVCQPMVDACNSSITYGGLPSFLFASISCHSCNPVSNVEYFPTVFMEYDANTNANGCFLYFSLPTVTNSIADKNHGFRCLTAPNTIVSSASSAASSTPISNCAVFGLLSAQTGASNADPTVINNYCLACASGYYPNYLANVGSKIGTAPNYSPPYVVLSCTKIANCDVNSINMPFNSCGKCSTSDENNPTPIYYAYSDFRLIACLQTVTQFCFIGATTKNANDKYACSVCQTGYILNIDGLCDLISIPNAASNSGFIGSFYSRLQASYSGVRSGSYDSSWVRIHYLFGFYDSQNGIKKCSNGYILGPPLTTNRNICVQSGYLKIGNLISATNYISNCISYVFAADVSKKFTCAKCVSTMILYSSSVSSTVVGTSCGNMISNCRVGYTTILGACALCEVGLKNLQGVCGNQVLTNCLTYSTNELYSVTGLSCSGCQSSYYLSINSGIGTCVLGSVPFCKTYSSNSGTNCIECKSYYVLVILANGSSYCFPIPDTLKPCNFVINNAQSGSISGFSQGFINCGSCLNSDGFAYRTRPITYWTPESRSRSVCLSFNKVDNCATYDQNQPSFYQNSFSCQSCISGYFFQSSSSSCIIRVNNDVNCLTFDPNFDKCTTCSTGYFLSSDAISCALYPTGVQYCNVYSSLTDCLVCSQNYFLFKNTCIISTVIENCIGYSQNYTCTACQASFFLQNNECVTPTATNCQTYSNISSCLTCQTGFGLNKRAGGYDCIDSIISSCLSVSTMTPFVCLYCQTGFYVAGDGSCSSVTKSVSNCVQYASESTCSICNSNSVLSPDGSSCETVAYKTLIDSNCLSAFSFTSPVCVNCLPGFMFLNGECVAFADSKFAGCYAVDLGNTNVCLFCLSGYWQSPDGSCNLITIVNTTNSTNNTNFTVKVSSIFRYSWFILLSSTWLLE